MRWDDLFSDLEAQLSAAQDAQFQADVSDLTRSERASIELAERLLTARGQSVALTLRDGEMVRGVVVDAAVQWLLLEAGGPQTLVPMRAVALVSGLPPRTSHVTEVERRLGIGHALRALARDRARVIVDFGVGEVTGLIAIVGADYVEVSTSVGAMSAVPIDAIMRVRSAMS
ncbi:MAG: hypothetical protein H5T82_04835 [Demequina sp.]|uniref:hypothetical protein n=1 Tax=Demequina sp. TaxID=2050685 RepID=UPI0019A60D41|nr:hypothetical protein [Demequina sp.]MBC7298201.1 hypothetical protein [Demequina sp.]